MLTADIDALFPDLYRCGMRFVDLLESVGEPAEAAVALSGLKASAAELRSRLVARGLGV